MIDASRRWIAHQLVRLAYRFYNPNFGEIITVSTPDGYEFHIEAEGSDYGGGFHCTRGIPWKYGSNGDYAELDGLKFTWRELESMSDFDA
jgi:hypothetical protein